MAQGGGWNQGPPGGAPPGGGGWDPGGAPPPGGFNPGGPPAPYGQPGPYAPPGMDPFTQPPGGMVPTNPGSLGLGIAAGFFGGCIGLILVMIIAKGPETKKGAGIGFGLGLVVGIIANVMIRAMR